MELHGDEMRVFLNGTLIGVAGQRDRGLRNVIVVGLASESRMHLGHLAAAFGITVETLRLLRRLFEREGAGALWTRAPRGGKSKVKPAVRAKLEEKFAAGVTVREAHESVGRRHHLGRSTVGRVRAEWSAKNVSSSTAVAPSLSTDEETPQPKMHQSPLPLVVAEEAEERTLADEPATETVSNTGESESVAKVGADDEDLGKDLRIEEKAPISGQSVQHLGTWLLLAMVARLGLHTRAEQAREKRVESAALRIALDAVVMALAIGERCVEGVRRLATPTGKLLLRADHAPAATWVRRVLGRFARELGAARLQIGMVSEYVAAEGSTEDEPAVFYVDNHMRPYTGDAVVRKGWRMQDKKVLPGATDCYVHDEDGRPVLRLDDPSHKSLTDWLRPIGELLREQQGDERRVLLAFDRGGAFPKAMAALRDEGFEFVTYERRPYPLLNSTAFDKEIIVDGETIGICDSRKNLGAGRGRVRRVALKMPDGHQVNLLAISTEKPEWLFGVMSGRWVQENGFKHGVERWGINQLDGRQTEPYPQDTIVPNPARRRLDRALRAARVQEGLARRKLAQLAKGDEGRAEWEQKIAEAMEEQLKLEAQRPQTPAHAPLCETELAGKLVYHTSEYKSVIDTIRIACANAESELAAELSTHLVCPTEAKKTLANLLNAPGQIRVGKRTVAVTLAPAGTKSERAAFVELLTVVNRWKLSLPGDSQGRRLRFSVQKP